MYWRASRWEVCQYGCVSICEVPRYILEMYCIPIQAIAHGRVGKSGSRVPEQALTEAFVVGAAVTTIHKSAAVQSLSCCAGVARGLRASRVMAGTPADHFRALV